MRVDKKQARNMAKLMAMMEAAGTKPEVIEAIKTTPLVGKENSSRQGDAVLAFIERPSKFVAKLCKRCGEAFSTNYRYVAYCSDSCRAKEMTEQLGVKWNYMRASDEERWGGEPPLIVPPKALQKIQQLTKWFSDIQATQTQIKNQPPSTQATDIPQESLQFGIPELDKLSEYKSHTTPLEPLPVLPPVYNKEEASLFGF